MVWHGRIARGRRNAADLSRTLFQRYNRIMAGTLLGVLLAAAGLIYLQADQNLKVERRSLEQRVREHAAILDTILKQTSDGVRTLQVSAQHRYRTNPQQDGPSLLMRSLLASAKGGRFALDIVPPPWTVSDLGNLTGEAEPLDPGRRQELEMALSLNPLFTAVKASNPSAVWLYYASARRFINIYPWVPSSEFAFGPALLAKEFFLRGRPDLNPDRKLFWTDAYMDEAGQGLMVTAAAPVYEGHAFRGIVALDLTLDELNRVVRGWQSGPDTMFVVNKAGQLLAHPTLIRPGAQVVVEAAAALPDTPREEAVQRLGHDTSRLVRQGDRYIEVADLANAPFRLVAVVPRRALLVAAMRGEIVAAVLLAAGLTLMLIVATYLTRREFIDPAQHLVRYIDEESRDAAHALPRVPALWRPWFETIRRVFSAHTKLVSIQQELDVARRMQQSIVPTRFPQRTDVEVFARMLPAKEVGGDFYDFFWLDDGRIGVVIADVSGKGVPAALFMAVSRTLLRATAPSAASPARCLERVNDLLSIDNDATMFVTLFYAILDARTGQLTYANGGHNPPCIVEPDGRVSRLRRQHGMALGVMPGVRYEESTTILAAGATLMLYTDGVTEAFDSNGQDFTETRLVEALTGRHDTAVAAVIETVMQAVNGFAAGIPQADDITCLALRYLAPGAALTDADFEV